jgi:mono/diheme cytochrome c family protein
MRTSNVVGIMQDSTIGDSTARVAMMRELSLNWEARCGEEIYRTRCATCHGESGAGDGFNASNLDKPPQDFTADSAMKAFPDQRLIDAVTMGGRSVNGTPMMPAYGKALNKAQIHAVVMYVRTLAR